MWSFWRIFFGCPEKGNGRRFRRRRNRRGCQLPQYSGQRFQRGRKGGHCCFVFAHVRSSKLAARTGFNPRACQTVLLFSVSICILVLVLGPTWAGRLVKSRLIVVVSVRVVALLCVVNFPLVNR